MQFLINQLFPSKSSSYKNANAVAKEVTEHYDRGNGFFDSFLGETMVRRMPHMQPRPCVLAPSAARSRSCQDRSVWAAALQGVPTLPPSPSRGLPDPSWCLYAFPAWRQIYTSAVFHGTDQSLEQAQKNKLNIICASSSQVCVTSTSAAAGAPCRVIRPRSVAPSPSVSR